MRRAIFGEVDATRPMVDAARAEIGIEEFLFDDDTDAAVIIKAA